MSTTFRPPSISVGGPPSVGRPKRSSADHRPSVELEWGSASIGVPVGRRSADPNAGLGAVGEVGWSAAGTTAPVASLDVAALALSPPTTAAMAWGGHSGPGGDDANADDQDFDIGMTRTVAAECLSPEMAAHLSTASDYLFAKKTRQVRFSSSSLSLERPDLRLRPLGRCAWADVLLPLHNGLRVVRWEPPVPSSGACMCAPLCGRKTYRCGASVLARYRL